MSITFDVATVHDLGPAAGMAIAPACMGDAHPSCSPDAGCPTFDADYGTCDCPDAAIAECPFCSVSVNVTGSNASAIADRLGITRDEFGSLMGHMEAGEFLGRAMLANVGRRDDGVKAAIDPRTMKAVIIDCGVRPGYFGDTSTRLIALAERAQAWGMSVCWA